MALRLAPVGHGEGLVSVARTRHPACGAEQAERGPRGSGTLLTCPSRIGCRSVAGRRIDASSVRISSPTHPPEVGPIEPKGRISGFAGTMRPFRLYRAVIGVRPPPQA